MKFGFMLPTRGPLATAAGIGQLVRGGEALGFDIVGVSDHVIFPRSIAPRYPYSETGVFAGTATGDSLEQLSLLSFVAGQTSRIRLLTSVMVLPHRQPVLAAKMLATVDVLSGGRVTVGCGAGWMREEFEVLGAPPFADRGTVADDCIRCFRELWTSDAPSFEGAYVRFADVSFLPKPLQKPCPPIWIGGESPAALRRAARLGDGWYPIGSNPKVPLDTLKRYREAVARLRRYAEEAGRDPADIALAYFSLAWQPTDGGGNGAERPLLVGSTDQIVGDIGALSDLGVGHLVLSFHEGPPEGMLERMERFAADVRPLVGA